MMQYIGTVKDGMVVLEKGVKLDEGARVLVEPVACEWAVLAVPLTLAQRMKDFCGVVDDMPADMAKNHDHYAHGAPKK